MNVTFFGYPHIKIMLWVILVSGWAMSANPAKPWSPEEMSAIWRGAFEDFAQRHQDLSKEQENFIGLALERGSTMAFADETQRRELVDWAIKGNALFAQTQMSEILSVLNPLKPWLGQMFIPDCNCSTILPIITECNSPCVANGKGVTCRPVQFKNGMCITQVP